jgi:hypothetical protein
MNFKTLASALLVAFAPGVALADLNYTDVELNFVDVELGDDLIDVDGDGFEIAGSYSFSDQYFLFGEYGDQDLDFGIEGKSYEIGGGFHHELGSDFDFVASISYIDAEVEVAGFSVDDDGFALGAGLRSRIARSFEVEGGIRYLDLDASGSDTGFVIGGRYYFNETFAVSAGTDLNDNADTFRIGVRAEF